MFVYNRLSGCARKATAAIEEAKKLEKEDFVNSKSKAKKGAAWTKAQRIQGKKWFKKYRKINKSGQYGIYQSGLDCINAVRNDNSDDDGGDDDPNKNFRERVAEEISNSKKAKADLDVAKKIMFEATASKEKASEKREKKQQELLGVIQTKYEKDMIKDDKKTNAILLQGVLDGAAQIKNMRDGPAKNEKKKYIQWLTDKSTLTSQSDEWDKISTLCEAVKSKENIFESFCLILSFQKDFYGVQ